MGTITRRKGGYDDAAHALVEASKEYLLVNSFGGFVKVETIVVGRLPSCLECIERVDKQIDCESSKCAGLNNSCQTCLRVSQVSKSLTIKMSVEVFPAISPEAD